MSDGYIAKILAAVAASGTQYTAKIPLTTGPGGYPFASIQLFWTGTVTGTWTIWVTDKTNPDETSDTDWTQLTLGKSIVQPAGAAGNDFVDLNELGAAWVRAKHVLSSGAGNIEAWAAAKAG